MKPAVNKVIEWLTLFARTCDIRRWPKDMCYLIDMVPQLQQLRVSGVQYVDLWLLRVEILDRIEFMEVRGIQCELLCGPFRGHSLKFLTLEFAMTMSFPADALADCPNIEGLRLRNFSLPHETREVTLPKLNQLRLKECHRLGWLHRVLQRQLRYISIQLTSGFRTLTALSYVHRVENLKVIFQNERVMPHDLVPVIRRIGPWIKALYLDGINEGSWPHFTVDQWQQMALSLVSLRWLAIRTHGLVEPFSTALTVSRDTASK